MDLDLGKLLKKLPATFAAIRTRFEDVEAGAESLERRVVEAEGRLAAALDTIEAMRPVVEALKGFDLDKLAGELDAFDKVTVGSETSRDVVSVEMRSAVAAVAAAVPGAAIMHVQEAVAAHAEAITDGTSHADAKVAAETAARDVGATPEQASAIAAAIPAPAVPPAGQDAAKGDPATVGQVLPAGQTTLSDGTVVQ